MVKKYNKGSSFAIKDIEKLFDIIGSNIIKEGTSFDKADIHMLINDTDKLERGWHIKSYLGSSPTLIASLFNFNHLRRKLPDNNTHPFSRGGLTLNSCAISVVEIPIGGGLHPNRKF